MRHGRLLISAILIIGGLAFLLTGCTGCPGCMPSPPPTPNPPVEKDAIISLNQGNPVSCSDGIAVLPLILDGWGDDVQTEINLSGAQVNQVVGMDNWQPDWSTSGGVLDIHLANPTRDQNTQTIEIAEIWLNCPNQSVTLNFISTTVLSGGEKVNVLAQVGTTISP